MIKQKAVKTFYTSDPSNPRNQVLNNFLNNGWVVVMCNTLLSKTGTSELEYIIQKETDE